MMMNNKKSPLRKPAKYLNVLPLALLLITAYSVYGQSETQQKTSLQKTVIKDSSKTDSIKYLDKEADTIGAVYFRKAKDANLNSLAERHGKPLHVIDCLKMESDLDMSDIKTEDVAPFSVLKDDSSIKKIRQASNMVDVQPKFSGGLEALINYLSENIRYPDDALKEAIEGKVIASFNVNKDGSIFNIAIVRSLHPLLDAEAVRVLIAMPDWSPATKGGAPIIAKVTLPVNFQLNYLDRKY